MKEMQSCLLTDKLLSFKCSCTQERMKAHLSGQDCLLLVLSVRASADAGHLNGTLLTDSLTRRRFLSNEKKKDDRDLSLDSHHWLLSSSCWPL